MCVCVCVCVLFNQQEILLPRAKFYENHSTKASVKHYVMFINTHLSNSENVKLMKMEKKIELVLSTFIFKII